MVNHSPSYRIKQVDTEISLVLRKVEIHKLSQKNRELLAKLQQELNDARIYSRDYEGADNPEDRMKNAAFARKWLKRAHRDMLSASEHNIFGAVEVAQLSAQIDQIIGGLK